jgi:hypothetical protein
METGKLPDEWFINYLQMFDNSLRGALPAPIYHCIHFRLTSFEQRLNPAVGKISHPSIKPKSNGCFLGMSAEKYSLDSSYTKIWTRFIFTFYLP